MKLPYDITTHEGRQALFNAAYRGLAAQGFEPAVQFSGGFSDACRYRTSNGLKCAIGQIIPDEEYKETMEGRRAGDIFHLPCVSVERAFLNNLQRAHDSAGSAAAVKLNLRAFAKIYNLEVPADAD